MPKSSAQYGRFLNDDDFDESDLMFLRMPTTPIQLFDEPKMDPSHSNIKGALIEEISDGDFYANYIYHTNLYSITLNSPEHRERYLSRYKNFIDDEDYVVVKYITKDNNVLFVVLSKFSSYSSEVYLRLENDFLNRDPISKLVRLYKAPSLPKIWEIWKFDQTRTPKNVLKSSQVLYHRSFKGRAERLIVVEMQKGPFCLYLTSDNNIEQYSLTLNLGHYEPTSKWQKLFSDFKTNLRLRELEIYCTV